MFVLPDLPYTTSALEPFIDGQTMEIHHGKHHAAYVKNLNAALTPYPELLATPLPHLLSDLSQVPPQIREVVRNSGGGHFNHSFFWPLLSPGPTSPSPQLKSAFAKSFTSLDSFQEKFTSAASSLFGSGWVWLVAESSQLKITTTPNQDCPLTTGLTPILALDVWEHAYYLKYQNRRAEYIAAWWNILNWKQASANFHSTAV